RDRPSHPVPGGGSSAATGGGRVGGAVPRHAVDAGRRRAARRHPGRRRSDRPVHLHRDLSELQGHPLLVSRVRSRRLPRQACSQPSSLAVNSAGGVGPRFLHLLGRRPARQARRYPDRGANRISRPPSREPLAGSYVSDSRTGRRGTSGHHAPYGTLSMRLEGFEPPTHGLEGRRSSAELQARGPSPRVQAAPGRPGTPLRAERAQRGPAAHRYRGAMTEATMQTNHGPIRLELFPQDAPKTVGNFQELARQGFYDGLTFHRVIEDFMVQGGCPRGDGTGGPGYTFEDEPNRHGVVRGALAMANAGPDTNGSQFFIVTADACPWLDGKHTVFGRVVEGMDVVDEISRVPRDARDRPLEPVVIERVELGA